MPVERISRCRATTHTVSASASVRRNGGGSAARRKRGRSVSPPTAATFMRSLYQAHRAATGHGWAVPVGAAEFHLERRTEEHLPSRQRGRTATCGMMIARAGTGAGTAKMAPAPSTSARCACNDLQDSIGSVDLDRVIDLIARVRGRVLNRAELVDGFAHQRHCLGNIGGFDADREAQGLSEWDPEHFQIGHRVEGKTLIVWPTDCRPPRMRRAAMAISIRLQA